MTCPACGKDIQTPALPGSLEEIKAAIERLRAKDRSRLYGCLLAEFGVQGRPHRRTHIKVQQAQQQFVDAIVAKSGPLNETNVSDLERLLIKGTETK